MSVCCSRTISAAVCVLLVGCGERVDEKGEGGAAPEPALERGGAETVPEDLDDDGLAGWFIDRGRYAEALPVVGRVVSARRLEPSRPLHLGEALMSLGMVHDALGDSSNALPPLAEAWELFQNNAALAAMLGACADALGLACQAAEKFDEAESAFLAAIEYRKAASPGDDEPWVSTSRMHLGRLYLTLARYEEAEPLLRAALDAAKDDAAVAARARQLGAYHHTLGAYTKAIPLFERARAATGKAFGEGGAQAAAVVGDLGLAQLRSGDLAGARNSLESSHRILAGFTEVAPDLLQSSVENLATFYLFVGEAEAALPLLEDASGAVGLNNLGSALQMTGDLDAAGQCFSRARDEAGRTLDAHHPLRVQILQNIACLRSDLGDRAAAVAAARLAGDAAVELLDHLLEFGSEAQRIDFRRTSDPLSQLCSFGAAPEEIAVMLRRTKGVVLDSLLAGDGDLQGTGSTAPLRLPTGATFVDYAVYQHYLGRGVWEQRYGGVVWADGVANRWVPLGTAKRLHALLSDLRAHVAAASTDGASSALLSCEAVLAGLYDFCIRPLGDVGDTLVLATDGDLKFVPFAALRNEGQFFCERLSKLQLVPTGRNGVAADAAGSGWAHCAVADYSGGPPASAEGELLRRLESLGNLPGVERERAALAKTGPFEPLPTSKAELLRKLSSSPPPKVLHFSCHGIFLGDGERPMSRGGLVLAGREMLFAGEISKFSLAGTELVTLSACDTGLGVNVPGEGVLGLQRGFQLAGARNILMSLWAVGDEQLPEFMTAFYRRIAAGESPSVALWSTQRARLPQLASSGGMARAVWIAGGFSMLGMAAE